MQQNRVATMMNTIPHELHEYLTETFEHAEIRPGNPALRDVQQITEDCGSEITF
ncbi:MAG: hypothetical protein ABI557_01125 [Aureliella sp.]